MPVECFTYTSNRLNSPGSEFQQALLFTVLIESYCVLQYVYQYVHKKLI